MTGPMRARRSDENPRSSGKAVGRSAAQVTAATEDASIKLQTKLRNAFMSASPFIVFLLAETRSVYPATRCVCGHSAQPVPGLTRASGSEVQSLGDVTRCCGNVQMDSGKADMAIGTQKV